MSYISDIIIENCKKYNLPNINKNKELESVLLIKLKNVNKTKSGLN
jgi:hypothetical protein